MGEVGLRELTAEVERGAAGDTDDAGGTRPGGRIDAAGTDGERAAAAVRGQRAGVGEGAGAGADRQRAATDGFDEPRIAGVAAGADQADGDAAVAAVGRVSLDGPLVGNEDAGG